jgi:4-alpha-glucanotransferase
MYRWAAIARSGYALLRRRGRRMADLYAGFRLDHLVGYFRTFGRPATGEPFFRPAREEEQAAQGLAAIAALREGGAELLAEDLGVVPDFVRQTLERIDLPGCKVMRWERAWHLPGQPFVDPASYPVCSMTVTGTHDLEPLAVWWDGLSADDREQASRLPALEAKRVAATSPWSDVVRDALLETACASASRDLFLPIQDVFGWRDRINTPATIAETNWTWRLPWPVDEWRGVPAAVERAGFCVRATARRR